MRAALLPFDLNSSQIKHWCRMHSVVGLLQAVFECTDYAYLLYPMFCQTCRLL